VDRIKQMLDTITELTDEQVSELQADIMTEFETVEGSDPTPDSVDAMTQLADMLDVVRDEAKRREAVSQELATRASEAAMRVKGEAMEEPMAEDMEEDMEEAPAEEEAPMEEVPEDDDSDEMGYKKKAMFAADEVVEPEPETTTETAEAEAEASIEVPAEAEASTQEITIAPEVEQEGQEAPTMTAAAHEEGQDVSFQAPADRAPIQVREVAPVVITAGADIPGYTAGAEMSNSSDIAEAMVSRLHGLRRVKGGDGEQHIVASVTTKYPESRVLTQDTESNVAKIKAVASPEAIIASGGHSTPFEVKYDIFGFGTTDRAIRDSLPRFAADRGGIRYILPPVLSDYGNAVGVWTNAVDTSPGTDVKSSLTITAATETTVATDAVTLQLQFGNLMTRAYPELVARHNELALIQHAREAELYLVSKISDASTAVTSSSLIGVARDFLVQVGRAATAYRSRHRLDPAQQLKVIAPSWIKDAMRADLVLSMPGDSTLNVADAEIDGYLAARGVSITFSLDLERFRRSERRSNARIPGHIHMVHVC
jgi:hypothetical protein